MKNKIFAFVLLSISSFFYTQVKIVEGENFTVNYKYEKDLKLVLCDDYTQYLFCVVNEDGMNPENELAMRKFDQKGNQINMIVKDYRNKSTPSIHNYLGSTEIDNDRLVAFTEDYSNKAGKKVVYQHVFNKKDDTFTTTPIVSYDIESMMKSGTTKVKFSKNGKYVAIINDRFSNKKIPNLIDIIVLDVKTLSKYWEKQIELDNEHDEVAEDITDSGRIVFLRKAKGFKVDAKILLASQYEQKEFPIETKLYLNDINCISINDQDYLFSTGYYNVTRINQGDFNYMLFLNLQNGNTVVNRNELLAPQINIEKIYINKVFEENGKSNIFYQVVTKTEQPSTQDHPFPDPIYNYEKAYVLQLDNEGKIIYNTKIGDYDDYRGKMQIFKNNGIVYVSNKFNSKGRNPRYSYISFLRGYKLSDFSSFIPEAKNQDDDNVFNNYYFYDDYVWKYLPEVNRLMIVRKNGNSQMSMISFYNTINN